MRRFALWLAAIWVPVAAAAAGDLASVESARVDVEPCPDETCVVLTWEGTVSNHQLGPVGATLVLVFYREDGSRIAGAEVGEVKLDRMERRAVDAVLEVGAPTWEAVYAVDAELADATLLGDVRLGTSSGTLVPDTRSSEEKAGDREFRRQQLELKVQRLERRYGDALADYDALKAQFGPFGVTDDKDAKKLKKLSGKVSEAAQDLKEVQRKLRQLR